MSVPSGVVDNLKKRICALQKQKTECEAKSRAILADCEKHCARVAGRETELKTLDELVAAEEHEVAGLERKQQSFEAALADASAHFRGILTEHTHKKEALDDELARASLKTLAVYAVADLEVVEPIRLYLQKWDPLLETAGHSLESKKVIKALLEDLESRLGKSGDIQIAVATDVAMGM